MPPTPARPGVVGRHHQPQGRLSGGMPSPLARMIATSTFTSQLGMHCEPKLATEGDFDEDIPF